MKLNIKDLTTVNLLQEIKLMEARMEKIRNNPKFHDSPLRTLALEEIQESKENLTHILLEHIIGRAADLSQEEDNAAHDELLNLIEHITL